jgi:YidC/Oxa1 family membrane protein insertase
MFDTYLIEPLLNILLFIYSYVGNFGVAIIVLTVLIRASLLPATLPGLKKAKKQKELQPEINELKKKYKDDPKKLMAAQKDLFAKHGFNPLAGCLPQILMLVVLIGFFRVISYISAVHSLDEINSQLYFDFIKLSATPNTNFIYLNISEPDPYYILPVVAALMQFLSSKLMMPKAEKDKQVAKETPESMDDMAAGMQKQMLYMLPLVSLVVTVTLPAGIALYIAVTSLFSFVQNLVFYGPDGLTDLFKFIKKENA